MSGSNVRDLSQLSTPMRSPHAKRRLSGVGEGLAEDGVVARALDFDSDSDVSLDEDRPASVAPASLLS